MRATVKDTPTGPPDETTSILNKGSDQPVYSQTDTLRSKQTIDGIYANFIRLNLITELIESHSYNYNL